MSDESLSYSLRNVPCHKDDAGFCYVHPFGPCPDDEDESDATGVSRDT
jgi:hypothetical protein